jgi:hypothetical protein
MGFGRDLASPEANGLALSPTGVAACRTLKSPTLLSALVVMVGWLIRLFFDEDREGDDVNDNG